MDNIIYIVNIADNIYLQVDIFGESSIVKGNGSLIKKIGNFDVECSNNYVYYANENKDISFIDFQGKEIYVLDHKQYELISTDQGNNILVKTVKEVEGKFEYYTIDITSGAATKISNYQGVIDSMYYYIDEENNQKVYKLLNGIEVARFSEGTTRIFNGSNGGIYFKDGQTIYKISK